MISGAHAIISSRNAEADRVFFRDILKLPGCDAGDGWLIFGLPPAEVAVHPSERNDVHEFYLMCDDVEVFSRAIRAKGVPCTDIVDAGWGLLLRLTLPGGGTIGVYEPRHDRPPPASAS